ncbi:hypothetical protein Riv7116_4023 [Rivularia sp. PCC 7116]|uniref:hypothetical protein n=1 Tax=Rivularia sp. PCC 7116 TaxID=373994 RepID=UPI00029EE861|nr:hypothetical protein [Rivularia sp. PCC 7116]AFY56463.1 hypothetical protein Riv7116_4023 [Rivularia sp. PCC 7116]
MKKVLLISSFVGIPILIILGAIVYYIFPNVYPKTYTVDCTQAKKIAKISDVYFPGMGFPAYDKLEPVVERYITKAVCLNDLKGDSSFNPKPYFLKPSDMSHQYQIVGYKGAVFRSPGSLKIEFDNGTLINFCSDVLVINCDRGECRCPHDFNWEPKPKKNNSK